ncbi:MAG: DUF5672 family protein [Pseudomonadota bacterium]
MLFTDDLHAHLATRLPQGIRLVPIPRLTSIEAYSSFVLRELATHIHTAHLLLTQWDGHVCDPAAWDDGFLAHDYIGAPWPDAPPGRQVGNGGFSLRSRKLLAALQSPDIILSHPEDLCICHQNKETLEGKFGIRFAPTAVARRFSRERGVGRGGSFGFHGAFHFPDVLEAGELQRLVDELPQEMTRSLDIKDLTRTLLNRGSAKDLALAGALIHKRFSAGLRDFRQWRLWATWRWKSVGRIRS